MEPGAQDEREPSWWVLQQGQHGPYGIGTLRRLATRGELYPDDKLIDAETQRLIVAGQLAELEGYFASTGPRPTSPTDAPAPRRRAGDDVANEVPPVPVESQLPPPRLPGPSPRFAVACALLLLVVGLGGWRRWHRRPAPRVDLTRELGVQIRLGTAGQLWICSARPLHDCTIQHGLGGQRHLERVVPLIDGVSDCDPRAHEDLIRRHCATGDDEVVTAECREGFGLISDAQGRYTRTALDLALRENSYRLRCAEGAAEGLFGISDE